MSRRTSLPPLTGEAQVQREEVNVVRPYELVTILTADLEDPKTVAEEYVEVLRGFFGKRTPAGVRGVVIGAAAGWVAWLVSSLLPAALAGGFLGLVLGLMSAASGRYAHHGGWGGWGGGGFGGGSSGGGWGGGTGGGGGWSGGGGMSGGGGASGSW